MKEVIALVIILACATSSFAQTTLPKSGLSAALQAKAAATTFMLDEPDSYCTVSPITPDGYLITALHCVRSCLQQNAAGQSGSSTFVGLQDLFVSTRSQNTNVVCNSLSIPSLGVKSVTVVATGAAIAQFDSNFMFSFRTQYEELKAHGFSSRANDFALLKINPPRALACWPIASSRAPATTAIWALGYPLPADFRKIKPVLLASAGHLYTSPRESRAFATATDQFEKNFIQALYSDEGVLFSNASNQVGQSGGPVIAADGTLFGIVSGYAITPESNDAETHELIAVSSDSLLKAIPPMLADSLLQKSAACR